MNATIEQLLNRRSIRNFTGESVKDADLNLILQAAQQAPTSINGQQVSLVVTRDKEKIKQIAEIAGGQPQVATADVFVTVVIDYHRAGAAMKHAGQDMVIAKSAEGIVVGSVDAGIAVNALQTAAESLGYGTTVIGGIRNNPQAMIDLLKLPENTYPALGSTIGVIDTNVASAVKPRVALESFAMDEKYDAEKVTQGAIQYDRDLRKWWDSIGLTDMPSYTAQTGQFYSNIYFPQVAKSMKSQGFKFTDEK
ncbi:NADPH-dependent oxidoreductase [Photobacterium rosenbergii]|uniref:NADPH-dependent oxidoreductase n=1 Tax=Photobacterium rosenbergii TaxID=294936 RepID=A0A2T3N847_9GAMM|nr:nitroreductase family protein [Photobacterium rosenbergii]PSW09370.1 NADPH-dependent oxidoreductase [Photobacterium rosenbergii]